MQNMQDVLGRVTIFSTGSKFQHVSNFTELHTPTLAGHCSITGMFSQGHKSWSFWLVCKALFLLIGLMKLLPPSYNYCHTPNSCLCTLNIHSGCHSDGIEYLPRNKSPQQQQQPSFTHCKTKGQRVQVGPGQNKGMGAH